MRQLWTAEISGQRLARKICQILCAGDDSNLEILGWF